MDKDLLRIVIIAIGIIVMSAMVIWNIVKKNRHQREANLEKEANTVHEKRTESLNTSSDNHDFDVVPIETGIDNESYAIAEKPIDEPFFKQAEMDTSPGLAESEVETDDTNGWEQQEQAISDGSYDMPEIIQIHIFALDYDGFKGTDIAEAFKQEKFIYGDNNIYESLDKQNRVKFSVASMVEPGVFPATDAEMESFSCPGIVFFLQPGYLDNPLDVFDEFIETIDRLTLKLDGVKLDHNREPLSKKTIVQIRSALSGF